MVVGSKVFGGRGRPLVAVDKEVMTAIFDAGIKYDFEWRDLAVEVHGESAISTAFLDGTITNADSSQVQGPWRTSTAWVKDGGKRMAGSGRSSTTTCPSCYRMWRAPRRSSRATTRPSKNATPWPP